MKKKFPFSYWVIGICLIAFCYYYFNISNSKAVDYKVIITQDSNKENKGPEINILDKYIGKYTYFIERIMGGYKISQVSVLTISKNNDKYLYSVFSNTIDEYNGSENSSEFFDGTLVLKDNVIIFYGGGPKGYGGRGANIIVNESDLNNNNIVVNFLAGRGNPMYFKKEIHNPPIFKFKESEDSENVNETIQDEKEKVADPFPDMTIVNGGFVFYKSNGHGLVVMTNDIEGGPFDWLTAKNICDELVLNGYSDWRLPSKQELNFLYNNFAKKGVGDFVNDNYWSSSECKNNSYAWFYNLFTGYQSDYSKTSKYSVRAVRNF